MTTPPHPTRPEPADLVRAMSPIERRAVERVLRAIAAELEDSRRPAWMVGGDLRNLADAAQ